MGTDQRRPSPLSEAAPAELRTIAKRVDGRLQSLLEDEIVRWSALDADLDAPIRELRAMVLSGGKRLRPAFVYWGYVAAGGDPAQTIVADAGAAFEMLHAFALIHDDIVDASSTRRGRQTAHLTFADRHALEHFRGEQRRYGEGMAVLIGDLAHVYADVLAADFPRPAVDLWNELRVELNIGQYLDLLGTARGDTDAAQAQRIARYKSAKYTIERPLHLGAALTASSGELSSHFTAYGIPLGEAFQMRDDLLGVFGVPVVTGKPVGDDLREGKPTPLLAVAVARSDTAQRIVLDQIGRVDLSDGAIAQIQSVMIETGSVAEIEARIAAGRAEALTALAAAPLDHEVTQALTDLAFYVTARNH